MGATTTAKPTSGVPIAPGLPAGSLPGYFTTKDTYPTSIPVSGLPSSDWSTTLWAEALISKINELRPSGTPEVQNTANNVANIERVIQAETGGQSGGFLRDNNPLNLNTYSTPHSSLAGGQVVSEYGIYVQKFDSIASGITATANELLQPSNKATLSSLQLNGSPSVFGNALSSGAWGGASYANATTFPTITPTIAYGNGDTIAQNNASATGGANPGEAFPGEDQLGTIANDTGITSVGDFLKAITNPTTLKNVGIFVLGLGLVVGGTLVFFASTKTVKTIAADAA